MLTGALGCSSKWRHPESGWEARCVWIPEDGAVVDQWLDAKLVAPV
jgi:hypothetical protein